MKTIFSFLFPILRNSTACLLFLLLFSSTSVYAQLSYITNGNSITITGSNPQASGSLVIPNSINNLPVTSIGYAAFGNCFGLTSVTLPSSITSIGDVAFYSCSGLTSVTLPSSITSIGQSAFGNCSGLTSVTLPSSITSIDNQAFQGCSGLTSVTLPSSITSIGRAAFSGCSSLKGITVDIANSAYSSNDGMLFNKAQTSLIVFPGGKIGAYTIPNSVTSIGNFALHGCSGLTSVTIPNSVTSIGQYAFYSCSGLTSVTLPSSITSIGEGAFQYCTGLTSVYFMGNAPTTGSRVFSSTPSTIYYIQGKTGWSSSFVGRPTDTFIPTPTPVITSAAIATATVGQLFSYTITAKNTPTSFNATGLPAGLLLNTATGVISGTLTTGSTNTITISASNLTGTGNQSLTLTVNLDPIITLKYEGARRVLVLKVQDGKTVTHTIEYSTDLKLWTPLATKAVGSTDLTHIDPQATTSTHHFYRVIKQ